MIFDNSRRQNNLREALAVVGLIALSFLLLTLLTWSPKDPSFSNNEETKNIANLGGTFGAHIAGLLFELFGRSAYLLCVILLLFGRVLIFHPNPESVRDFGWCWAAVGTVLFMISSAAIESLRFRQGGDGLPDGAGGFIGGLFAENAANFLGSFGASLLFFAIWILSWSLAAGLSWFSLFERIGEQTERLAIALFSQLRLPKEESKPDIPVTMPAGVQVATPPTFKKKIKKQPKEKPPPLFKEIETNPSTGGEERPTIDLLDYHPDQEEISEAELRETADTIVAALANFNVTVKVAAILPGPVITRYDLQPATGVKGSQIVNLARDLARSLSVSSIRVLETIPGTHYIGLELPNATRSAVSLHDILSSDDYRSDTTALPLGLGKTAAGDIAIADLATMPHLLVAGSTGSGKSVFINAILLSLLFARSSEDLRLLLIDPKMLELAAYADIPHLLAPVVTDMDFAPGALNWAVEEMETRYRKMATTGARHIVSYNNKMAGEENAERMPYIVIIIDELADLMMVAGKKVELSISRLAQKARAAGIHMILATQRPSVDVITGLIKANVPCRLSFQVASKIDSRTILDQMGAETLLGKGDMLFLPPGVGVPKRLHGAFVSDSEVHRVVKRIRAQSEDREYIADFSEQNESEMERIAAGNDNEETGENDPLYDQAVEVVIETRRASISLVQRKLRIGYNRAARLIEQMEAAGLVSPMNEMGVRKVLPPK